MKPGALLSSGTSPFSRDTTLCKQQSGHSSDKRAAFEQANNQALPNLPAGRIHATMTIKEITARICAFRDARDWQQFHNPKDMAVAIAAEAGELMQHFVWKQPEQIPQVVQDKRAELTDEIADVAILLFELAHNLDIPLAEAMQAKLDRNEKRYPADKARGNNLKYNELGA